MQVIIKNEMDEAVIAAYESLRENEDVNNIPFLTYSWVSAIEHTINSDKYYFLFKDGKKYIAIAALKIDEYKIIGKTVRILKFLNNNIADYNGILYTKTEKASQIAKYFIKTINSINNIDAIDLENLPDECNVSREILSQLKYNFKHHLILLRSECPKLMLKRKNIDILKKTKQDTNRCLKRLEEQYNIEIKINQPINKIDLENIFKLKEKTYGRHDLSVVENKKIIFNAIENGISYDYSYLKCNNEIIAVHFGFKNNNTLYYYVPTFNRDYSKYSVGNILLMFMIEYYNEHNFKEFDFLRGDEQYKKNWSSTTLVSKEGLASLNTKGYLYISYIFLRRFFSKKKKHD